MPIAVDRRPAGSVEDTRLGRRSVAGAVFVLVPAHNEEDQIVATLAGLAAQTLAPREIVVICDNCTDGTERLAREHGATVFITHHNNAKKAGALNQALRVLLPELDDDDMVLVQDADSSLDTEFVATAVKYLRKGYGGVGGVFRGSGGGRLVGHLQRNEYARYARDVTRLGGKCLVITGTAALFPVPVLRQISAARRIGRLPVGDGLGGVYDTTVLTEDNELTFALMHLGHKVISPPECTLETEVMSTWRELWTQRLRWKRGAIENCFQYGFTRITWRYWGRQLLTGLGVLVSIGYLSTLALIPFIGMSVQPIWMALTVLFMLERAITVRYRGWGRALLAITMYELVLDYFLQACHAKAYLDALMRRTRTW